MMYPMISGLDELIQANALVEECKQELRAEGIPFDEKPGNRGDGGNPLGGDDCGRAGEAAEIPEPGDEYRSLIQYTLAVDRMNEKVAHSFMSPPIQRS